MPMWIHEYVVEGKYNFPIDMLRYDGSYPADQESVSQIGLAGDFRYAKVYEEEHGASPVFKVRLKHITDSKQWAPTEGRWNSFGWKIKVGSLAARKY